MADNDDKVRAVFREIDQEAIAMFDDLLPVVATLVEAVPSDKRASAVVVLADWSDAAGRLFSDEILRHFPDQAPPKASENAFYTVQPLPLVVRAFENLGLVPVMPSLVDPVSPEHAGAIRVLIIVRGVHTVKWWTPRLAKGGTA